MFWLVKSRHSRVFANGKLPHGWFQSPDVQNEGHLQERPVHVAFGVEAQLCFFFPENSFMGGFRAQVYISKATFQKDGCTWLLESRHNLDRKLSHGRFQSPDVSKATFRKDLCTWLLESRHNLVFANRKILSRVVLEPRCTYRRLPAGRTGARSFWSRGTTLTENSHTGGFRAQMYRRPPSGKTCARGFWSRGTTQAYRQFPTEVVSESRCTAQIEGHIRETPVQSAFDIC